MADASKELQFKLTTVAELQGARDLATELERQIGRAKALKQDYSNLAAQLEQVNASIRESIPAVTQSGEAFDKVAFEAENAQAELDKLGSANDELSTKAVNTREKHRALEMTMLQLNQLVPGLGDTMFFLASGYKMNAEAAEAGAAANEDFLQSMGGLSVLILAIQAAVTWYHFFADAAKDAQEIQSHELEKLVEGSQKALAAWQKLQDAIQGKSESPTEKYEKELEQRQKIIDATHKQTQAQRENAEAEAMAGATSPEQKEIIKREFEQANAKAAVQDQADAAEQQAEIAKQAQADLDARLAKIEADKKALAQMPAANLMGRTQAMNDIAKESDDAATLQKYINNLTGDVSTGSKANSIDQDTWRQTNNSKAKVTFEQAVTAGLADHTQKVSDDQKTSLDIMNQIFKSLGGSFQPVLDYLKTAHLNQQQFQAYVQNEINMLKQAQSKIHNDANASY